MTKVAGRQRRDELKRLIYAANGPDKGREPLSQNSAPAFMVLPTIVWANAERSPPAAAVIR
jgi:hypothetical protein